MRRNIPRSPHYLIVDVSSNRTTSENTLFDLIRSAEIVPIFLLDTESTPIPYRPNEPALIQLQIVPPEKTPTIVLVEVNHLPPVDSASFGLIQEFFTIALNPEKEIYSWGSIDELNDFVKFGLFTQLQLDGAGGNNLQKKFKRYLAINTPAHRKNRVPMRSMHRSRIGQVLVSTGRGGRATSGMAR